MDLGLKGRKAIVCASSRGLGKGCAVALAREGCDVVVNGRDADTLSRTADDIRRETAATVTEVAGDVSDPTVQSKLLEACPAPDVLINNNGGPPRTDYTELDRDAMIRGVVQNMVTPIELIQAVLPGMAERGFGRVVNITSLSVMMPIEGLDLSSAARAGLTAFLAGVCRTVAHRNVTVNAVLPGKMDTDRLRSGLEASSKRLGRDVAPEQRDAIPAKRFGEADEFGAICAFLCSEQAAYIVGRNIVVDGGLYPSAF